MFWICDQNGVDNAPMFVKLYFTYWTAFISTPEISHFHSADSLPHPMGGSEWVALWGSAAYPG